MKVMLTVVIGAVVLVGVDNVLKIDMSKYPAWKRIAHVVACGLYGVAIVYAS